MESEGGEAEYAIYRPFKSSSPPLSPTRRPHLLLLLDFVFFFFFLLSAFLNPDLSRFSMFPMMGAKIFFTQENLASLVTFGCCCLCLCPLSTETGPDIRKGLEACNDGNVCQFGTLGTILPKEQAPTSGRGTCVEGDCEAADFCSMWRCPFQKAQAPVGSGVSVCAMQDRADLQDVFDAGVHSRFDNFLAARPTLK
ncbi:hypothetical protein DFJ73DRAFT_46141 [Zopfochytrium polystomum]|nr:hypothetical protein DFJ73DRAFT_46141 [Zopfochytrium polystomum]